MSCNDIAIRVLGVSKFFEIYEKPSHRLLQMLYRGRRQFYRPFWALDDVSFDVARGECVGIIGRNGAGKSTLLQIITGTLAPSCGEVSARGRVAALLELGSGFNPEFTGRENVYLNASILGLGKREIDAKYDAIVAFADIGEFIDQPVKSYSSGMTVRLAFAVVAHVDADVLIVDEALAVGDAFFTQKCMRFLRRFMEENTVLFVSHDVSAVNSLCNRAVLLENGKVKFIGPAKSATEMYLEDMFESMQGKSACSGQATAAPSAMPALFSVETDFRDMRQDFINATTLRNDIEVFRFDAQGAAFGKGGAVIENAVLADQNGAPCNWIVGGEIVTLHVLCRAHEELFSPTVGFHLKDRLGQILLGDNTYLSFMDKPLHVPAREPFSASFTFRMPLLAAGDYSFTVAIAEGTQADHVQHQWRHDAVMLKSVSTSVHTGIVGVPMREITLGRPGEEASPETKE
jgi:ABC-type polysaccharide/polyol phosphate transport system, ATPase component